MSLTGKCIVVTRPAHQAKSLMTALKEAGAEPILMPLIEVYPLKAPGLPSDYFPDEVIFTSANAATYGVHYVEALKNQPVIAMGDATKQALIDLGFLNVITPAASNSESVLEIKALQVVQDKKILFVTGKSGRGLLQESLSSRGADVLELIVYERRCPDIDVQSMLNQQPDCVVITSNNALENLLFLTSKAYLTQLLELQLVVVSPRIAEKAKALGFSKPPIVASGAVDSVILRALS